MGEGRESEEMAVRGGVEWKYKRVVQPRNARWQDASPNGLRLSRMILLKPRTVWAMIVKVSLGGKRLGHAGVIFTVQ